MGRRNPTGEKVGIVGSREYPDLDAVRSYVEGLGDYDVVVTGGAHGVDDVAEKHAKWCGLKVIVFRPDLRTYGRGAYAIRNHQIVEESDRLVAFWDGISRGTKMTMDMAQKAGKPCLVFGPHQCELFEEV